MNRLRKTKVIAQASTSIFPLESSEHVPRIYGRHHPESPLAFDFQHVRSPDQVVVAKPTVLVLSLVAKKRTDAVTSSNLSLRSVYLSACHNRPTVLLGNSNCRQTSA